MNLAERLKIVLEDFSRSSSDRKTDDVDLQALSAWDISLSFTLNSAERIRIRNVASGDLALLRSFGDALGAASKDLFCPYPWDDPPALEEAFHSAIRESLDRKTASYVMTSDGSPVGHFFLWAAGGNAHSRNHGLELPELGVAVADAFQGRGFGFLAVRVLQEAARSLRADGIELTTAMENESGWNTYRRAGFEYTGILRIPLGVDVTAATAGLVNARRFRAERQMAYVIDAGKKEAILHYLESKRIESENKE